MHFWGIWPLLLIKRKTIIYLDTLLCIAVSHTYFSQNKLGLCLFLRHNNLTHDMGNFLITKGEKKLFLAFVLSWVGRSRGRRGGRGETWNKACYHSLEFHVLVSVSTTDVLLSLGAIGPLAESYSILYCLVLKDFYLFSRPFFRSYHQLFGDPFEFSPKDRQSCTHRHLH